MRRPVVQTMSLLSVAVAVMSVRAGAAPFGVPLAAGSTSAPSPVPAPARAPRAVPHPTRVPVPARPSPAVRRTRAVQPAAPPPTSAAAVPVRPAPRRTASSVTVDGPVVGTAYGPVQVQITVTNGRITRADAVQHPTGGRSDEINSYAVPQLDDETLQAQSAQIDTVSGATYTSDGYRQSLQAALDKVHLS